MRRASKGSTTQRGYGAKHQAMRAKLAPLVDAGQATCWRCGRPITPGQPWDLGHDDVDRTIYRGPEHRGHNRSAGARKGNRLRGLRRQRPSATTQQPIQRPATAARWYAGRV